MNVYGSAHISVGDVINATSLPLVILIPVSDLGPLQTPGGRSMPYQQNNNNTSMLRLILQHESEQTYALQTGLLSMRSGSLHHLCLKTPA